MKRYYAPVAKTITLDSETLIAASKPGFEGGNTEENCSNHRTASSSIWGDED